MMCVVDPHGIFFFDTASLVGGAQNRTFEGLISKMSVFFGLRALNIMSKISIFLQLALRVIGRTISHKRFTTLHHLPKT
jgi:hypothetical protein